jgi:hypothetical protein
MCSREEKAFRNAAADGSLSTVVYLVERGANVFAREEKALRKAVANGYFEIVKYLVESGGRTYMRERIWHL